MTHLLHLPLMDDILVNELHNVNLLTFNSPLSSQYWIFQKWRQQSFFMYRGNGVSPELSWRARRELRHSEHLHPNPSENIELYCLIYNSLLALIIIVLCYDCRGNDDDDHINCNWSSVWARLASWAAPEELSIAGLEKYKEICYKVLTVCSALARE